jgi:hypothetical protein
MLRTGSKLQRIPADALHLDCRRRLEAECGLAQHSIQSTIGEDDAAGAEDATPGLPALLAADAAHLEDVGEVAGERQRQRKLNLLARCGW